MQGGGLRPQHLSGIVGISEMYRGVLLGAAVDSTEIVYRPAKFGPGQYLVDIKTAGTWSERCASSLFPYTPAPMLPR